ncbi:MAG: hypothetical protein ACXVI9_02895, partial [Mucilaginibacter sp.]
QRDQVLSQIKLQVDPLDWLTASYQISNNFGIFNERMTKQEADFTAYGISDYWGAGNYQSGFASGKSLGSVYDLYSYGDGTWTGANRIEGDAVLSLHHNFFKDIKANLIVGNTIWQKYDKSAWSGSNQLLIKDLYNEAYIGGQIQGQEFSSVVRQISFFGDLSLSYKGWLTLEGTFRNEDDSRLSKTNRSFNYPSAKVSFVPTDALPFLKDNKFLNYLQLRGGYSQVGNINVGAYTIQNINVLAGGFPYGSLGGLQASTTSFSPSLKPELTREIELGMQAAFFNNRLNIDYTWYKQNDKNQTRAIGTSITTGYNQSLINVGETQSTGNEVTVTGQILTKAQNHFGFSLGVNFAKNEGKLLSLLPGVNSLQIAGNEFAVVGKPFPWLEGTDFVRDPQGHVVVSATTGYPTTDQTKLAQFGRTTPEYIIGVTPTLSYKFVTLSAVFEYRGGDVVYDALGGTMTFAGSSALTAEAGRQRFIYPNSVIQTSPGVYTANTSVSVANGNYGFWQGSAFPGTVSPYVTSGAFWKLRELNLSFNLDQFIKQTKFIRGATFALTGRNLFIWVPKSNIWTDPEFSDTSATSNTRGVNDANILPGTRIFGADLKLTF